jgi:nanoRNase/pAp phosphatase (c-di-AMP/oligoRNAs hydrolase)
MKNLAKIFSEKPIDEILAMPDVKERLDMYFEQTQLFKGRVEQHAKPDGNVLILDLREVDTIYAGNRFLLYTLYPAQNISMWIVGGRNNANVVITVGYSIINRTATIDVGSLLLHYGGGGHRQVGTCQVSGEDADRVIAEIVEKIK